MDIDQFERLSQELIARSIEELQIMAFIVARLQAGVEESEKPAYLIQLILALEEAARSMQNLSRSVEDFLEESRTQSQD